MSSVAICDYGMGNLDSVYRAVEVAGGTPSLVCDPRELSSASHIILPGVGAFQEGMARLRQQGFEEALQSEVQNNRIPLLGICLGMQLLAESGVEGSDGAAKGLGWIRGQVVRMTPITGERVPHIGWNEVVPADDSCSLFSGIPSASDFYFVHSYHFACHDKDSVLATTPYCGEIASAVLADNVSGVQFHPEKSQRVGLKLLENFLAQ